MLLVIHLVPSEEFEQQGLDLELLKNFAQGKGSYNPNMNVCK